MKLTRISLLFCLLMLLGIARTAHACDSVVIYDTFDAVDLGGSDSGWDSYGDQEIDVSGGTCSCIIDGIGTYPTFTFADGADIVHGSGGIVSAFVAGATANPLTTTPVQTGGWTFGYVISCSSNGHKVSQDIVHDPVNLQYEIAYTKLLETGIPNNCSTNNAGVQTCDYGVATWCLGIPSPDFAPTAVRDSQFYGAWNADAACARRGGTGTPWTCAFGFAVGTTNLQQAGSAFSPKACTYNP